ncbi:MAG TPA: hypothetical protein VF256_19680 [Streptosporangiaceae bacterium]|jgi:hypothetical protein
MSRRLRAAHDAAASPGAEIMHPLMEEEGGTTRFFIATAPPG